MILAGSDKKQNLFPGLTVRPSRLSVAFLVMVALSLQGCLLIGIRPVGESRGVERKDLPRVSEIDGDRVFKFLAPDRIPSIEDPEMISVDGADFMRDDELVMGVEVDGETRAYSLWHLDRHEVVNDMIGGAAIAATW